MSKHTPSIAATTTTSSSTAPARSMTRQTILSEPSKASLEQVLVCQLCESGILLDDILNTKPAASVYFPNFLERLNMQSRHKLLRMS